GLATTASAVTNHAVTIVGWDDNQPYDRGHDGSIDGQGCWIVKNSWGTGWGGTCGYGTEKGYFYIAYANAEIGTWASYIISHQNYDTSGGLLSFDDAGWGNLNWGYSNTTCWALCRYAAPSNTQATAIEFWTNDVTTDVDVYLYNGFNPATTTLGTLLASSLDNAFPEAGYHAVSITPTNIGPASNPEAVAVVKITNSTYTSPIPADYGNGSPPLETNRCYISPNGNNGSWFQTSTHTTYPSDLGVRIRTHNPPAVNEWMQY
ncbi:MAG TPA: lectin like domain-containing protein, partial [bacterium]|nr:lectin like domain-containing protein [bacterium]